MGAYFNPGATNFKRALCSQIYVDKTDLIKYVNSLINTEQCYVSVSRPRRFGKSITANMLCAYYGRGADRSLFEGRKIADCEDWDQYLGAFNVIRIVMTDFIKDTILVQKAIDKLSARILSELSEEYPDVKYDPDDLAYSMDRFYRKNGIPYVIIIDEWDAVFRIRKEDDEGQRLYLAFLQDWLKGRDYVALAYMTGILPIKKYGRHSALNMFDEYSIITPMQMASYTGFTEKEVRKLCEDFHMSYDEISDWYDGYNLSDAIPVEMREKYRTGEYDSNVLSVYNPLSVVKAVSTGIIRNYWNKTETYEALAEYIRLNLDGLKDAIALMMDGGRVKLNISTYQNDMTSFRGKDDVMVLLIHLGYLCYDIDSGEAYIPNKEIMDEFRNSTDSAEWAGTFSALKKSQELLLATWKGDTEQVAEILEYFHDNADNKTYNSEAALSYAIQMAYYAAQKYYTNIQELDTGKGYADLVYIPSPKYADKPALLIELKYNESAETAMKQIKEKKYFQKLEHYRGKLLLVGISYKKDANSSDKNFKHHKCIIERWT